jgi:putative PIN family toxin of toxin-antitoxin system
VKVVIDANVFVSAAIQRGASHRIVMSWLAGTAEFELVMCPELLAEVREVLTARPRLRRWITLEDATQFVDAIELLVDLVDDPGPIGAATRDHGDDYLVALARGHGVDLIVSGDHDLLEWEVQDPPVIRPSQFERRGCTEGAQDRRVRVWT